jgi:hypothetical protein
MLAASRLLASAEPSRATSHYKARLARRRVEGAQTCDRAAFVRRNDKGMKDTSVETRTSFRCQWEVEDGARSEVEFPLPGLQRQSQTRIPTARLRSAKPPAEMAWRHSQPDDKAPCNSHTVEVISSHLLPRGLPRKNRKKEAPRGVEAPGTWSDLVIASGLQFIRAFSPFPELAD